MLSHTSPFPLRVVRFRAFDASRVGDQGHGNDGVVAQHIRFEAKDDRLVCIDSFCTNTDLAELRDVGGGKVRMTLREGSGQSFGPSGYMQGPELFRCV